MNPIISKLVLKDFLIVRKTILIYCLITLASIVVISSLFGRIPNWAFFNLGFSLLILPVASCGILLLVRTIVLEKEKSTQSFIMSLPVTVKEFTQAKLLVNLPLFSLMWIVVSAIAFYFAFGLGVFPKGAIPFVAMIFLGIFAAYIGILSASLLFQSMSLTILSIMVFDLGTVVYLWIVAYLEPIKSHVYGENMVWNSTAISIVTAQILAILLIPLLTYTIQNKKRDFI